MEKDKINSDNNEESTRDSNGADDDLFFDPGGFVALTEEFLLNRGYCCGGGCINCPYDYKRVPEPHRSILLEKRRRMNNDKKG